MRHLLMFLAWISWIHLSGQVLVDGDFTEWDTVPIYTDPVGDHQYFDLINTQVHSDAEHLYFTIEAERDWQLNSDYSLLLYLDTDANSSTGTPTAGMGADLIWSFAGRNGQWNGQTVYHDQIGLYTAPTVTSNRFEIALERMTLGLQDSVRFIWKSMNGTDDILPNQGFISHVLQNDSFPYTPIDISRNPQHLRVMTYNIEHDGLVDPVFGPRIRSIIQTIDPDVITFNELWNTSAFSVKSILDTLLPQANGWYAAKLFEGNVTASRYPISHNETINNQDRMLISQIDLPAPYNTPLLVANLHLKCCDDDERRQDQVDDFVSFYRALKDSSFNIPWGAPFLVMGDMNLVGDRAQLQTLLTGDVIQETTYGPDQAPDWDGSAIRACMPLLNDHRHIYTWPGTGSSYYPGKLDYIFYSDYSLILEKSFVYSTFPSLAASDHLPVIADFSLNPTVGMSEINRPSTYRIYGDANTGILHIYSETETPIHSILMFNSTGEQILQSSRWDKSNSWTLAIHPIPPGVYTLRINHLILVKFILL